MLYKNLIIIHHDACSTKEQYSSQDLENKTTITWIKSSNFIKIKWYSLKLCSDIFICPNIINKTLTMSRYYILKNFIIRNVDLIYSKRRIESSFDNYSFVLQYPAKNLPNNDLSKIKLQF